MNRLEEILTHKEQYVVSGSDKYTIDGTEYRGFTKITFFWEKTYVNQPGRTMSGAMGNLDTLSTFCTPHLIVDYDIMPINDFRAIMKLYNGQTTVGENPRNEFVVKCYDPIYERETENIMYLTTPKTPDYYTEILDDGRMAILGVKNYTIELVGTNRKE